MRYSDDYQTVRRNFHQDHFLHNITLRDHDGGDNLEGSKALEKMVAKRMETTLIAGDALQAVVAVSGGIPLELVKLVSSAAIYALERDERAGQIELADAQNAIKDLRRELAANLSLAEWTLLDQRHKDRKLSNEPAVQQLLYKGALIEYANDVQWCDVHPALWSVLDHYVEETA